MDKQKTLEMISDIAMAKGPSGFEDEVLGYIRRYGEGLGSFEEDKLRNLYLRRRGNTGTRPLLQLDAHTDEVGFMVQHINPNGTLRFVPLGGWNPSTVPAHRVLVRTAEGQYIPGVVASKPPHYLAEAERKAAPALENMVIDIGATSRKDAVDNFGVRIGEPVVPESVFEYHEKHDLLMGKAFDCRLGCAGLLSVLDTLQNDELDVDVVAAFSSQEEVGTRGAIVTSATLRPSIAIVLEGCPADDTFGDSDAAQTVMKKGPMLRHMDARMITNPRFQRYALDIAQQLDIPVQPAVRTGGATNGGAIHLAASGVPVIVIGLAVRYIHTHNGIAAYADYEGAIQLASAIIRRLDKATLDKATIDSF